MNNSLRTAILIVAAMIASALIVAGLFGAMWNVNLLGKGPADFLPKDHVHAILFHPTPESLQEFPFIEKKIESTTEAIAIFDTFDTVIFTNATKQGIDAIGPYSIEVSSTEILPLVRPQELSLNTDPTFRKLAINQGHGTSWTYFPTSAFPHNSHIFPRILKAILVERSVGVAVTYEDNALHVEHIQERSGFTNPPMIIPNMPDAFLRASGKNFAESFYAVMNTLSGDDAVILEGILSTTLAPLGEGISFRYDLLPLLEHTSTIQVGSSGSLLNVLIDGSMQNTVELQTILDRMHTAYESSLPSSMITKRILDKRFSSVDIRHETNMIEQHSDTTDGWHIRSTMLTGRDRGLATATRGTAYLLSSSRAAINHAIAHQEVEEERYSAKMLVDLSKIDKILPYLAISEKDIVKRFGTGTLSVISHQEGIMRKISLKASKNPLQLLEILGE